jgi:ribose transport system permease protein
MSAPATGLHVGGRLSLARNVLAERPWLVLIGVLFVLVAVIAVVRPGTVGPTWVANTILFAAPLGIVAAGQTLVMLTGGIDLSVAAVMTAAAYVAASESYFGSWRAVFLALGVGLLVGVVNGLGVAIFRVQPLIMTLGMGLVVAGSLLVYQQTTNHQGPPAVPDIVRTVGSGKLLDIIPNSAFVWTAIAILVIAGLRYTGLGRLIYAVGDNPVAVRLAGARGWLVLLATYIICGFLSGVAGLVLVGAINAADLSLGDVYLLPSVAAVVIGGTSIYGGHGGYAGSLVGALILSVLSSLFTLVDAPDPLKQILYGAIVVLLAALYVRTAGDTR